MFCYCFCCGEHTKKNRTLLILVVLLRKIIPVLGRFHNFSLLVVTYNMLQLKCKPARPITEKNFYFHTSRFFFFFSTVIYKFFKLSQASIIIHWVVHGLQNTHF